MCNDLRVNNVERIPRQDDGMRRYSCPPIRCISTSPCLIHSTGPGSGNKREKRGRGVWTGGTHLMEVKNQTENVFILPNLLSAHETISTSQIVISHQLHCRIEIPTTQITLNLALNLQLPPTSTTKPTQPTPSQLTHNPLLHTKLPPNHIQRPPHHLHDLPIPPIPRHPHRPHKQRIQP